jgi:hypothetical protein
MRSPSPPRFRLCFCRARSTSMRRIASAAAARKWRELSRVWRRPP